MVTGSADVCGAAGSATFHGQLGADRLEAVNSSFFGVDNGNVAKGNPVVPHDRVGVILIPGQLVAGIDHLGHEFRRREIGHSISPLRDSVAARRMLRSRAPICENLAVLARDKSRAALQAAQNDAVAPDQGPGMRERS